MLRSMDEDRGHLLNDFVDGLTLLALTMTVIVIALSVAHALVPVLIAAP
jgi:hypothetical protein